MTRERFAFRSLTYQPLTGLTQLSLRETCFAGSDKLHYIYFLPVLQSKSFMTSPGRIKVRKRNRAAIFLSASCASSRRVFSYRKSNGFPIQKTAGIKFLRFCVYFAASASFLYPILATDAPVTSCPGTTIRSMIVALGSSIREISFCAAILPIVSVS